MEEGRLVGDGHGGVDGGAVRASWETPTHPPRTPARRSRAGWGPPAQRRALAEDSRAMLSTAAGSSVRLSNPNPPGVSADRERNREEARKKV